MASTLLDDALYSIGKYGRYQIFISIIISIIGTWFPAWHMMGIIFSADRPNAYHCTQGSSPMTVSQTGVTARSEPAVVAMNSSSYTLTAGNNTNSSSDVMRNECLAYDGGNGSEPIISCTEWQYERLYNESTIVTNLDLVCDRKILAETAQSIFLFGMLTGSLLFGYLSDVFGRKIVFIGTCVANGVCGIAVAFVWNYAGIVALWFLNGMFAQGFNQVQFVMVMEMFPSECRTLAGSINNFLWGIGIVTLAPIAYAFKDWRHMQLAISIPCLVTLPLWLIMDESVRWLLAKGREDEARIVLEKMARWNKSAPPPGGFLPLQESTSPLNPQSDDSQRNVVESAKDQTECTIIDVFKSRKVLLNMFIVILLWFVGIMTYYGASLNVSRLAGNKYANFLFLGLAEMPGYIIIHFTMTWWGRRPSLGLFFLVAGIANIAAAFLPKTTAGGTDLTTAILISAMLVKLCIVCSYSINIICCTEILPTPVRNIGFGIGALFGNIGTVIVPFIIYLDEFASFLPLTILGGLCIVSSTLVPILPETKDKPLPETIKDAENIGRTPCHKFENGDAPSTTADAKAEDTVV